MIGKHPENESVGGPGRVQSCLINEYSKNPSVQLTLITPHRVRYPFKRTVVTYNGNITVIKTSYLSMIRVLKFKKYDVVNLHGVSLANALCCLMKKNHKIPIVASVHGLISEEIKMGRIHSKLSLIFEKIILSKSDIITTVSQEFKKTIVDIYGISPSKLIVIHNGIKDSTLHAHATDDIKKLIDIVARPYVLFVGVLLPIKGIDILIDAFSKVKTDATLLLVGKNTEYFKGIKKNYTKLFASGRIVITGYIDNATLESAYAHASVFILPSRQDSCPLVTLEAMARGIPIIISDRVGTKQIIKDSHEGFIVSLETPERFTLYTDILLRDVELRKKMGINAKNTISRYTWTKVAQCYLDVYNSVM